MNSDYSNADQPRGRRELFWRGLGRILKPMADYIEERLPIIMPRDHLRPPGAISEPEFRQTCYRCGNCIGACPASAIRRLSSDDPNLEGTPYIDPDLGACQVCANLECMRVCPSGALKLVDSKFDIRMGTAQLHLETCLRTHGNECTLCVDRCPMGAHAILINSGGCIEVLDPGCIGCGMCQSACPTTPKAIRVEPV